jgi:hypothetical protein
MVKFSFAFAILQLACTILAKEIATREGLVPNMTPLELKKFRKGTFMNGNHPFVPLVFLHMRKSGGSNLLGMIDYYWYAIKN